MKLCCPCGHLIADQVDMLPFAGYFIADQDVVDFFEAIDREPRKLVGLFHCCSRPVYECTECGRLALLNPTSREYAWYRPEAEAGPHRVFGSKFGAQWRTPLWGMWFPSESKGDLRWLPSGDRPGGYERFDRFDDLQVRYFEIVARLQSEGRLRASWLTSGQETVHHWAPAEPASAR